ncbi:MAG: ribosome-associated translation inhibitor RaiA [Oscillospiraceae bacterium]|jgi:putative sigma-54 modulation protein|nr:ribosome-associated translation inhibitor RaiA [Oscillospiraceae bacterium]
MNITTTGRNTSIRDAFKASLQKKLSKLDRFFDEDASAIVTVINEGGRETVEVTIKSGGMTFRAEKTSGDRLDSLDVVVDALFKQIVKNKTRLEKRLRKTAFEPGYDSDFIGSTESYEIVKSKRFQVKPMDVEEAILQMNLIGHSFFMFRNIEGGEICVVYKRNNGNYGLLEPED